MSKRSNRRDLIVETASNLFIQQGYSATSVRQIADQVGCTEAAIYYHFKEGKRQLLQAVVEANVPDLMGILEACREAESLTDLVTEFVQHMARVGSTRIANLRWIVADFPRLTPDERALFHEKYYGFYTGLKALVGQFVSEADQASRVAWLLSCASFGYVQLFYNLDLRAVADFEPADLMEAFVEALVPDS